MVGGVNGERDPDVRVEAGGGGRAGLPEDPPRLVESSSPRVAEDAPTDATHLSQRQDHAARAGLARQAEGEEVSEESWSSCPPSAGTFKRCSDGRGLCEPRPHPAAPGPGKPRGFPHPRRPAGGVGNEPGRLRGRAQGTRTEKQKAGIPPLPTASRPLGNFPPTRTAPLALTPYPTREPTVSRSN